MTTVTPTGHGTTITVNGRDRAATVEARQLLVYFLREQCGLPGTKVGCDTTSCGACTVLLNDEPVKACTVLAVQADGQRVTTVEGLAGPDGLHPIQNAFHEQHALQCGFCTAGMMLAAVGLIAANAELDEATIRSGLEGNLCRCTGYHNIVKAIQSAHNAMRSSAEPVR